MKLRFTAGNAKLSSSIYTFSLPAGHTCPFADKCLSKVDKDTGKIKDGPNTEFRCYAASQEITYPNVRNIRWNNLELLKQHSSSLGKLTQFINDSLPETVFIVRIHASGDFYSERYFLAWLNVAVNNPKVIFYGYTKAIPYLIKYKNNIPSNFRFTSSFGGKHDNLIENNNLKYVKVVYSPEEAINEGLELDHDDSHAIKLEKSFALLIHGIQPRALSKANTSWKELRKRGIFGYGQKDKKGNIIKKNTPISISIPEIPMVKVQSIKLTHNKGLSVKLSLIP